MCKSPLAWRWHLLVRARVDALAVSVCCFPKGGKAAAMSVSVPVLADHSVIPFGSSLLLCSCVAADVRLDVDFAGPQPRVGVSLSREDSDLVLGEGLHWWRLHGVPRLRVPRDSALLSAASDSGDCQLDHGLRRGGRLAARHLGVLLPRAPWPRTERGSRRVGAPERWKPVSKWP